MYVSWSSRFSHLLYAGAFDVGMNTATIQHICRLWEKDHPDSNLSETPLYMVTKQSGRTGGFDEKLEPLRRHRSLY